MLLGRARRRALIGGGNPVIEDAAAGVARGSIEALGAKAGTFLQWVAAGKLRFLGNPETVAETKKKKGSPEWMHLKSYLPTSELRTQVLLGLELRDLDIRGDRLRLEESRRRLLRRYDSAGLHVAELAQLGIVTDLVNELIKRYDSPSDVAAELTRILTEADSRVRFVKSIDSPGEVARLVEARLDAHGTQLLIAKGTARGVLEKTLASLKRGETRAILDHGPTESRAYAMLFREDMWPGEEELAGPGRDLGTIEKPRSRRHRPLLKSR